MWMVVRVQGTEQILRGVLDQWKAGVDAHEPQKVAQLFTEDAVFQGLRPYSVGRDGVADYYDSQPLGMTVTYRILETRTPADGLVIGYARADFAFPDRDTVSLNLGVVVSRRDDGWRILHYQVSPIHQRARIATDPG
jgi:uncharacterized protein (TIGR02246 family)